MKKFSLLIAALSFIILAVGCSDKETQSSATESTASQTQESTLTDAPIEASSVTEVSCDSLASAVIESVEFPDMVLTEEKVLLDMIMDFSQYGIEEYAVYQQAISVNLSEVIVLRTTDTKAATEALEKRKEQLINQLAFYPEQQENASSTIVGSKGGYC